MCCGLVVAVVSGLCCGYGGGRLGVRGGVVIVVFVLLLTAELLLRCVGGLCGFGVVLVSSGRCVSGGWLRFVVWRGSMRLLVLGRWVVFGIVVVGRVRVLGRSAHVPPQRRG